MMQRGPSTVDWMLPPEAPGPSPGDFEDRWNVAPARQMSVPEAYAMGGLAGVDTYDQPSSYRHPDFPWTADDKAARDEAKLAPQRAAIDKQYRAWGGTDPSAAGRILDYQMGAQDMLVPKSAGDVAMMLPVARAGRAVLGGLAALDSDEAQAGAGGKLRAVLAGKPGGPTPSGIHAYHSSPHDFDRFDLSKLRTGEGANVYGAGTYLAENPAVSGQGGQYWHQFTNRFGGPEHTAATYLGTLGHDRDKAIETLRNSIAKDVEIIRTEQFPNGRKLYEGEIEGLTGIVAQRREALKMLESGGPIGPRTYEVNFKAKPEELLDWDKPLKAQSEPVKEGIARRYYNQYEAPQSGETMHQDMVRRAQMLTDKPKEYVAEQLQRGGIPGIRYLDQGSRPAANLQAQLAKDLATYERLGNKTAVESIKQQLANPPQPSYNYVAFDPSRLDIMAKYGVVGAPAGLALGGVADQRTYD